MLRLIPSSAIVTPIAKTRAEMARAIYIIDKGSKCHLPEDYGALDDKKTYTFKIP